MCAASRRASPWSARLLSGNDSIGAGKNPGRKFQGWLFPVDPLRPELAQSGFAKAVKAAAIRGIFIGRHVIPFRKAAAGNGFARPGKYGAAYFLQACPAVWFSAGPPRHHPGSVCGSPRREHRRQRNKAARPLPPGAVSFEVNTPRPVRRRCAGCQCPAAFSGRPSRKSKKTNPSARLCPGTGPAPPAWDVRVFRL